MVSMGLGGTVRATVPEPPPPSQPINSCNVCEQIYPAWVCAMLCG